MDKMQAINIFDLMRKACHQAGCPNHYASDLLADAALVLKYGMTKFLWCLRESGTFIIAIKSDKQMSEFDIEYDAAGMKQYPEAKFFIVDEDAAEPYQISYEKAMKRIDRIQEGMVKKHVCNY